MKKIYLNILGLIAFMTIGVQTAEAQCVPRVNNYHGEILANGGCGTFTTVSPYSPGTYFRMPVLAGASYTISTCGSSIDTQITGFQGNVTATSNFYNDDNGPDCSGLQASINITPTYTDYTRVAVQQYNCQPGGSASITVKVRQNNNLTITSSSAAMCEGETRALTATPVAVTGALAGSGDSGTFSGTGVTGTTFTAPTPAGSSQVFTITYTFGYCSTTQDITVYAAPTVADAGIDQTTECGVAAVMQGNSPAIGTGAWTIVSGPGTVSSPSAPNSTVTGLTSGTTTVLEWTITNGPCAASTDQVILTTVDSTDPVPDMAALPNVTASCQVDTVWSPYATDACMGSIMGVDTAGTTFPITAQGTTVITWAYDDGYGNIAYQSQNVIITDTVAPVATASSLPTMQDCWSVDPAVPTAVDNCADTVWGTPDVSLPVTTYGLTTITWTFDDGNGNTSTQTQDIYIQGPDASVTQTGAMLTAVSSTATYQWLDCNNGYAVITGATSQSFTPTDTTGSYAVQVTENGCVDTSACYTVDYTGLEDISTTMDISIYPNPSDGKFNVEIIGMAGEKLELRITDLQGRIVMSETIEGIEGSHIEKVDISKNESGAYFVHLIGEKGVILSKQIVKK